MRHDHFQGKSAEEHLKAARAKGSFAVAETHGIETPGYISAATDSAKETATLLLVLWLVLMPLDMRLFFVFLSFWMLWKAGRSALLGWGRLEKLHRLIAEEQWEIEHHREQEKEELTALYRLKGFEGKLLGDVITTLMSDDNRLLRVMLEEELGLKLEAHEHPLKQAAGAALGVGVAAAFFLIGWVTSPHYGPFVAGFLSVVGASWLSTKYEKNRILEALVWNSSVAAFAVATAYVLSVALGIR